MNNRQGEYMQQLNELKNELTKDFGTIAVDSNIQADVSKYKEMGVFGRWIYRAFTDNQILDKAPMKLYCHNKC